MRTLALVAAIVALNLVPSPALAGGSLPGASNDSDPRELRLAAFQKYLEGDYASSRNLYDRAIDMAQRAYGKDSSFVADLYYEVGTISLEDGQFSLAEKYLKEAVRQKPNSVMARVKYADVLTMRGSTGDALAQIQQALRTSPGSPIAQQAMVRWMMGQASARTADGAVANVAATWECFRLRAMGKDSVSKTMASIQDWRHGFSKTPQVKVATANAPTALPIKTAKHPTPAKEPDTKRVTKLAPPKAKPKLKPPVTQTAIKPPKVQEDKPEPVRVAKAKEPVEKKEKRPTAVATVPIRKTKAGLVPPPPPLVPVFNIPPPPPQGFTLQTTAKVKDPEKPKKKPKPQAAENDEDPDYLLDWASDDDKKKNK